MGIYFTPWTALPILKKNGEPDRLKRFHILGSSPGRGKPVIADKIRTKEQADVIAAAPELLEALEDMCRAYKALCDMTGQGDYTSEVTRYAIAQKIVNKAKGLN